MASILNAKGVPLRYSEPSVKHFSATNSGPTLNGSGGHDSMWGDANVTVTMYGGTGDDIYYLYSGRNSAFEYSSQGIDTISTWMSHTLAANIENLKVTGNNSFAFGNRQNNIITGGSGRQTLDGLFGNDVLTGGGGSDVFVFKRGNGSDLIVDFASEDIARIKGYGLTSFEQVQSRMVQVGDDVRLNLSGTEFVVFTGKTIDQFSANQFQLELDTSRLRQTFADEFHSLSLWNGESGRWDPNFWWGGENGSSLSRNGELQWYIDPHYATTAAINPFSVANSKLTITAAPTPEDMKPYINGYDYTSGLLTTYHSFAQTYGYFSIRADMPDNQGTWPAFWLLPVDGTWPPELDIIEMTGQEGNKLIQGVHSDATGSHTVTGTAFPAVETTDGYHTYGVLWTEEEIIWYFDNVETGRVATPDDMHKPMYLLVNLAVGGIAGTPEDGLATPAEMRVDYIRAYSLNDWLM